MGILLEPSTDPERELVVDLMTKNPICVTEADPVSRATKIMTERRVRHVPIVDAEQQVVGILSMLDLLHLSESQGGLGGIDGKDAVPIGSIMARGVDMAHQRTAVRDAAMHMLRNKRSALPVVDDGGKLVGILTEADFLRKAIRES